MSELLEPQVVEVKEFFVRYGDQMSRIGILYEGVLVSRYVDENGNQITSKFYFPEGDRIVADYYSFKENITSSEEIQAIERAKLLVLKVKDFQSLVESYPKIQSLIASLAEASYLKALGRIRDFQLLNSKERLAKFLQTHKSIAPMLTIKDKASYLGMTRNIYTQNMKKI